MTDKKTWTMPRVSFVRFAADEYVNACTSSSRTVYDFICDLVDKYLLFNTNNNTSADYEANKSLKVINNIGSLSFDLFSAELQSKPNKYNQDDQLFYVQESDPKLGHTHETSFSFTLEEDQKNSLPTVWYNATEDLESTVWNPAYIWHDTTQNILHASSAMNSRTVSNHS